MKGLDSMFDKYIDNLKNEIILETQKLIQIPSVYSKSDNPSHPFGENANKALEYILDLGKKLGFRTKNIDGYCGYIEFGKGDKLVGIIGHLDVVPEGDNWTFPPFSGTISDNKIFGRGSIDDKGPVIASLYAMKTVMDDCKIDKRVRLILGLNEENDWECIKYYKEHEEWPTIGFSPDADFPCIYAEKGIISTYLSIDYSQFEKQDIILENIDCNNNAINVVPKICSCVLKINNKNISSSEFINNLKKIISEQNSEIDIYKIDEQRIKLTSHGIQAHAAHPDLGVNSISRLVIILDKIFKTYNINIPIFDFFNKYINIQYDGTDLGISCEDESGKLTLNVGKIELNNHVLKIGMNLRVPIKTKLTDIEKIIQKQLSAYGNIKLFITVKKEPLYVPKDSYLVKTLCNIFNEATNSRLEPIAIGGATYARAFENCISFGANLPSQEDMCHKTDEFISIDNLILATKIYARAIYEL